MKVYTCKYCKKEFNKVSSFAGHSGRCILNPKSQDNKEKVNKGKRLDVENQKNKRIEKYNLDPSKCNFCQKNLNYKDRRKKYCNSSCSAKVNNTFRKGQKRIFSEQGLENIRKGNKKSKYLPNLQLIETIKLFEDNNIKYKKRFKINIYFFNCKVCNKLFTTKNSTNLTCSSDCRTILIFGSRKYHNGKKHYHRYFNKWIQNEVILEGSWEVKVAELLDKNNIKWERPKPLKWIDSKNINRLYFPDFYLNDYDIYLDPKNPYCMKQDEEKMKIVSKQINIEYGHIEKIIKYIQNLK